MNSQNNYAVLRIVKYCLATYSHQAYTSVFEPLRKKNRVINCIYTVHKALKPSFLSTLMIACQGIKSYLALTLHTERGKILATAIWTNELKQIGFIESAIGKEKILRIEYGLGHFFRWRTIALIGQAVWRWKQLMQYFRIVGYINRNNDFMPACMAVMGISYYLRFAHELRKSRPDAVLMTSYYSPDANALFFAAQKMNIKTTYFAHAFTPPDFMQMKLHFDHMMLQSPQILSNCRYNPMPGQTVSFTGIDAEFAPMRLEPIKQEGMRVGIFLSSPVNIAEFARIIDEVQVCFKPSSLLIRAHPEALTNSDLHTYITAYTNTKITFGTLLADDVAQCDIALVGASGVTLQLLRMGLPCVYYAAFEPLPYDYCGFVSQGILLEAKNFLEVKPDQIKDFYLNYHWRENFLAFDPFYGENIDKIHLVSKIFLMLLQ